MKKVLIFIFSLVLMFGVSSVASAAGWIETFNEQVGLPILNEYDFHKAQTGYWNVDIHKWTIPGFCGNHCWAPGTALFDTDLISYIWGWCGIPPSYGYSMHISF